MSHKKIMAITVIVVIAIMLLTGCSDKQQMIGPVRTVEVKVPFLEQKVPPAELLRTPIPADQLPEFVAPTNPAASSCLTPKGEPQIRSLFIDRESKLDAWEKWGFVP